MCLSQSALLAKNRQLEKQKKTIWFFSGFLMFSFVFLIGPKGTTTIGRTDIKLRPE